MRRRRGTSTTWRCRTAQIRLAQAVAAAGKPVVLVLVEGRPRLVRSDRGVGARRSCWPSTRATRAAQPLADVLFGDVNPSGKLPITYPRYANALLHLRPQGLRGRRTPASASRRTSPQFDFGFGLSYTTFAYSGLVVEPTQRAPPTAPSASPSRCATAGAEPAPKWCSCYLSDLVASLTPPVKRLTRFAKLTLPPGESRELRFRLGRDDLSFIGADGKPVVEPGLFTVLVGDQKQDFEVKP